MSQGAPMDIQALKFFAELQGQGLKHSIPCYGDEKKSPTYAG